MRLEKSNNIFKNKVTRRPLANTQNASVSFTSDKEQGESESDNKGFSEEGLDLDDSDSNLFKKKLLKNLSSNSLRTELNIQRVEKKINLINQEMTANQFLKLDNFTQKNELLSQQYRDCSEEIKNYKSEYRQLGIMYAIADSIADFKMFFLNIYSFIKAELFSLLFLNKLVRKTPGYTEKQKIMKMNLLYKKLKSKMKKKSDKNNKKELEDLLSLSENLTSL